MDLIEILEKSKEHLWNGEDVHDRKTTRYVCFAIARTVAIMNNQPLSNDEGLVPEVLHDMIGDHINGHSNTAMTFLYDKLGEAVAYDLSEVEIQAYRLRIIDSLISILSGGKKDEFFSIEQ
jgi:hypothetical protein